MSKDDDFSLVAKTLSALLTEQHRFSDVSKRQGEVLKQHSELLRQQGEMIRQQGEMIQQQGEMTQQQGEMMEEQIAFSEGQEGRLKELIDLMGAFADGTTSLRQRMASLEKRVDELEKAG